MGAADLVFGVCLLLGGGLLLLTLVVDDIFGGLLGALHLGFDVAGVSPTPLLLGFVAMFGAGGLVSVGIPANHFGTVLISFAGASHNMTATADSEIPAGRMVKVVAVAGGNLVVVPSSVPTTEGARSDA